MNEWKTSVKDVNSCFNLVKLSCLWGPGTDWNWRHMGSGRKGNKSLSTRQEAAEWAAAEPRGDAPGLQMQLKSWRQLHELRALQCAWPSHCALGMVEIRTLCVLASSAPCLCVGGGSSLAGSFPSSESPSPGCQSLKRGNMKGHLPPSCTCQRGCCEFKWTNYSQQHLRRHGPPGVLWLLGDKLQ